MLKTVYMLKYSHLQIHYTLFSSADCLISRKIYLLNCKFFIKLDQNFHLTLMFIRLRSSYKIFLNSAGKTIHIKEKHFYILSENNVNCVGCYIRVFVIIKTSYLRFLRGKISSLQT